MNFKDFYSVLLEANVDKRIEYIRKKYGPALESLLDNYTDYKSFLKKPSSDGFKVMFGMDFPEYIVKIIDPYEGIYSDWIVRNLLKEPFNNTTFNRFLTEDFYKVYEDLQKYHRYKNLFKKLAEEYDNPNTAKLSDINQIKGFDDLYEKLRLLNHLIEDEEEKESLKAAEKEVDKLYDSSNYLVLTPKTVEASCAYGRNTRWCTASTGSYNYFDNYNTQGPLYIIINKKTNQKHQFHFASKQYMDENDDPVEVSVFVYNNPEIKNILVDLALKNENLDFVKEILPFGEIVEKIETMDESTKIKMIRDNFVIAYYLGLKDPELVNNNQKLIHFNSDESINLNTGITRFSDIADYLMNEDDAYRSQRIYDEGYDEYIYSNASNLENDDWDWLNDKNFDKVKKYCRNVYPVSFKKLGDYDSLTMDEVQEFLKDKDDDHVDEQLTDSYRKVYINESYVILESEIDEKIFKKLSREYSYNNDNYLIFKMNSFKMDQIVKDFEKNPDEIPSTTNYGNFMRSYRSVLENEGDLVSPNFNADPDLSADNPDQYKMFNDYFSEYFSIGQDVYDKDQLQFDFSGVNRDMNNFDRYVSKLLQELNMAKGGIANQSGGTSPQQNTASGTQAPPSVSSNPSTKVNQPKTTGTNSSMGMNKTGNQQANPDEMDKMVLDKGTDFNNILQDPDSSTAVFQHISTSLADPNYKNRVALQGVLKNNQNFNKAYSDYIKQYKPLNNPQ